MTIIKTSNIPGAPLVDSDSEVAFYGPNLNWVQGGHFTLIPFSNYAPANGDKFIFTDPADALGQVTPAGFAKYTPYYIVNTQWSAIRFGDFGQQPGNCLFDWFRWFRPFLHGLDTSPCDRKHGADLLTNKLQL